VHSFRLHEEQFVSDILFFIGRVEDRLRLLLSDARDSVVPQSQLNRWYLKRG
jgi:hypothetical protein